MCPQLRHHESAKIRLEAQRQTQVNVSSVSFGEHKTGQFIVRLWLWRQSAKGTERADSSQLVAVGRAKTGLVWIIKRTSYCAECYHDKIVAVFISLPGRHVSIIFSIEIIIFHYRETDRARPICICREAPSARSIIWRWFCDYFAFYSF